MSFNRELLKGSTVVLILSQLEKEPMYGYQLIKEIERSSGGVFQFREGTLYPLLHNLESEGMLEAYWSQAECARRRKYYRITDKGRKRLQAGSEEWKLFRSAVDRVLKEARV